MSKPLSPDEIKSYAGQSFPDYVFDGVNNELARRIDHNGWARLIQNDVADAIVQAAESLGVDIDRSYLYSKNYMDFEPAYRAAGWKVTYYKSPYYSSDDSYFEFEKAS
jgi:hypothetical protein